MADIIGDNTVDDLVSLEGGAESRRPSNGAIGIPQISAHAVRFLSLLDRENFEFRCFQDQEGLKRRGQPQRFVGCFGEIKGKLRKLNEAGYGIFVQINASDGKGNKASNITTAPTFFADLDGTPLENLARLDLAPHLLLETSPGKFHSYWRVEDIPITNFKKIQQRLAKLIGSDPAVCDLPRVMRLPGFLHQKDPMAPYLVHPLEAGEHPPFSFSKFQSALEIAEAIYLPAPDRKARLGQTGSSSNKEGDLARDEQMLRQLISTGELNLATYKSWIDLGIALKNSHNEAGFAVWNTLSSEADNYEDEESCRKAWDAIKPLSNAADRRTVATYWKQAKDGGYEASSSRNGHGKSSRSGNTNGSSGKIDQAIKVLDQVEGAGDERYLDLDGRPHVRFRQAVGSQNEHWANSRINSELYRGILRRRFYLDQLKSLSPEQLNNAIALLEAEAIEKDERHEVYLRSGMHRGNLYVDLRNGDGAVIEVTKDGWAPISDPPVRFVAGSRGALPVPEHGGKLADFERHMAGLERADVQRVLAFAINTFNGEGTYPMLQIVGGHGSGKSIKGDMVVALTDPPSKRRDARFSFAAREQDLLIHAQNARVLYFDNVSSFGPRDSDTLCRLLSGAAFSTRQLYTMDEEHRIALRRPVIATSIGMPTIRGDLIDRTLPVTTHPVAKRLTEEAVWKAFKADLPRLFGLVLNGVSAALRNRATVQARITSGELKLPRLADFAAFAEGAAEVLELAPGEFCAMLRREQASIQTEVAAGNPLGGALIRHFSFKGTRALNCTAAELLSLLSNDINERKRGWPATNKVRECLERIQPGLRDLGVDVQFTRPHGKRNVWTMQISVTDAFYPEEESDSAL